jgi:NodT family efflux transporter outer membrane factor (OMF) lipoprotein
MTRRPILAASAAALLSACTVGPDYHPPETHVPDAFGELQAAEAAARAHVPVGAWWTTFKDPVLDSLVARAVHANPDLRSAAARVREARALRGIAAADLYPTVDATGGASRARTSETLGEGSGGTSNLFQAGFDAVWEVDVFGGTRRTVEAADADVGATIEDSRDVHVSLCAEVARNYMELRGAQRQTAIAQANLAAQSETLDLTRQRLAAGLATDLDVARSEAQVAATASTIPGFEADARFASHALAVLVDLPPTALVEELSKPAAIPAAPPEVPVGLPSELLRRRPDVRRAERRLAGATARIGAAVADYFPRFSLTGGVGLANDGKGDFLDARSRTGSIGGFVRWPVLDFGRVRSNVDAQNAREEQLAAEYETVVLTSLREVEDALVAIDTERARHVSLAAAEAASARAVGLANQLWTAGRTDFLSVLDAQRALFLAQAALVDSDRRAASNVVALYKALGGGWEVEAPATEEPDRGEPGRREIDFGAPTTKRP